MIKGNQGDKDSTPKYIRRFLKKPPLFLKSFNYEDALEFLSIGVEERYLQEEIVITEDENVSSAYLVVKGSVSIWKENIQLATLTSGNFLGETFLFSKNTRVATVVSEGDSVLLRFGRAEALNFFRKKPEKLFHIFTRNIIEIQRNKISDMNNQLFKLKVRLLKDSDE